MKLSFNYFAVTGVVSGCDGVCLSSQWSWLQSTARPDRRLPGLGVVVIVKLGWELGVVATAPLPTPPLVLTLALVVSAPLRNFLKVIGGRPGPPVVEV